MTIARLLARPSRYAQIGLICALLNNLVVIAFDRAHYSYAVALCVAFVAVTTIGYLLHTAYTFRVKPSWAALLRFFGGNLSGFFLSMLLMIILCSGIHLSPSVGMPIATVLLFAWNYALASWAIGGWNPRKRGVSPASGN